MEALTKHQRFVLKHKDTAKFKEANAAKCKKYRETHPQVFRAAAGEYRARKLQAMPPWVDTESLKAIYDACPEGFHVDHIVPLKHKLVCGLHVPANLQYLSAADNRRKKNTLNI